MSSETAFLQAIQAEPDDALTFGVFADWLEERGDPRSDLVRALFGLRGLRGDTLEARLAAVRELLGGLAGKRLRRLGATGAVAPDPRGLLRLRLRGLPPADPGADRDIWDWITEIAVSRLDHVRGLERITERLPLLRRITFQVAPGQLSGWNRELAAARCRPLIQRLEVHDERYPVGGILQLPPVLPGGPLSELSLRRCYFTGDIPDLFHSPALRELRRLELPGNRFSSLRGLVTGQPMEQLEVLSLEGTGLGDAGIVSLVESRRFPGLREVYLDNTCLSLQGIGVALRAPWMAPGRAFRYTSAGITYEQSYPEGGPTVALTLSGFHYSWVDWFERLPLPPRTTTLRITLLGDHWRPEAVARTLAMPALQHLRHLTLVGGLGRQGIAEIVGSLTFLGLETLTLEDNQLTAAALEPLQKASLGHYPALRIVSSGVPADDPIRIDLGQRFPWLEGNA
jgi:uncharacterized protein (TIGR02996 family)